MAKEKYGKYIINDTNIIRESLKNRDPFFHVRGIKQWPGLTCQISVAPVSAPLIMEAGPMKHDFDQIICFIGGNPKDVFDFGAEVELCLGDEQEKHIIKSPTAVYIPKGLTHCPLNFKIVSKPIIFLDIALTSAYTRKEKSGTGWSDTLTDEEIGAREVRKYGVKKKAPPKKT